MPAARKRASSCWSDWEIADDVVVALGVGEGEAEVAGTDPPGRLTCQTGLHSPQAAHAKCKEFNLGQSPHIGTSLSGVEVAGVTAAGWQGI